MFEYPTSNTNTSFGSPNVPVPRKQARPALSEPLPVYKRRQSSRGLHLENPPLKKRHLKRFSSESLAVQNASLRQHLPASPELDLAFLPPALLKHTHKACLPTTPTTPAYRILEVPRENGWDSFEGIERKSTSKEKEGEAGSKHNCIKPCPEGVGEQLDRQPSGDVEQLTAEEIHDNEESESVVDLDEVTYYPAGESTFDPDVDMAPSGKHRSHTNFTKFCFDSENDDEDPDFEPDEELHFETDDVQCTSMSRGAYQGRPR